MLVFLTLGPITFQNFEIPEGVNFGGDQILSVKTNVGGERQIDAMGRQDDDITWSGLFSGVTANYRASFLDGLRVRGQPLRLTWSRYNFSVLIKSFKPVFNPFNKIPYTITCTVLQDLNKPFPVLLPTSYNDAIQNLLNQANDIAFFLKNPSITSAMALVSIAINDVPSVQNSSAPVISGIANQVKGAIGITAQQISQLTSATFQ